LLGHPRVTKDLDLVALADDSDVPLLLLLRRERGFEPRVADAIGLRCGRATLPTLSNFGRGDRRHRRTAKGKSDGLMPEEPTKCDLSDDALDLLPTLSWLRRDGRSDIVRES
jgi:hypothetical protein